MPDVRPLTTRDLPACLSLSAARGWPREERKWRLLLGAGEGLGIDAPEGGLAGCVVLTTFGDRAAALGMMLVAPAHERRGLGRRIVEAALARAGARTTLLHATAAGQPLYERTGFVAAGHVVKHVGPGRFPAAPPPDGLELRPLEPDDRAAVHALDEAAFGAPRTKLLDLLLPACDRALVARRGGRPVGYGALWDNLGIATLGPIVAEDDDAALALAAALAAGERRTVRIDVPAHHAALRAWAVAAGITPLPDAPRMIHGPELGGRGVHALAAQAFG